MIQGLPSPTSRLMAVVTTILLMSARASPEEMGTSGAAGYQKMADTVDLTIFTP